VHARGSHGLGTLEPGPCGLAVASIRARCPGIPVGLTTGAWIEPNPDRRLSLVRSWPDRDLPDFCSVNFSEPGAAELGTLLMERGVGVEAGVVSVADVRTLVRSGLAGRCLRILVEPQDEDPDAATSAASAVEVLLKRSRMDAPLLVHGQGRASWPVLEFAMERGHDLRIGLEDTLEGPDGWPTRGNEELVAAARRLIEAYSSSG
jgi:uncharacterized protein (DUF849 family)